MLGKKGNRRRSGKTPQEGDKPVRDKYDWLMFLVQAAGVAAIVVTIVLTQCNADSSSRDMANALGTMANIAETLQNQQEAIINQSEATENLASETNTVAAAAKSQAETSAANAKTAQQQLTTANRQLSQNVTLFAAQHRPMMALDNMGSHNHIGREGNVVSWDFDFKNFGTGPAYNVFYYEAVSVDGVRFQELGRKGSRIDLPNTGHWSTAFYTLKPGESISKLTLRVRFVYADILGNRYDDTSCVRFQSVNVIRDCTEPQPYRRAKRKHR